MAEQHSEWCKDSRWAWAPGGGEGAGHAPTEFWRSAQCFPQSLSLILKHVSHNAAHTVPSTRGPVCHFPPQILLVSGLLKTVLKCYLHKPSPGPWPEEGSPHSLYVIRILCPPFAAFATVLFTITVTQAYVSSSSPERLSTPDLCVFESRYPAVYPAQSQAHGRLLGSTCWMLLSSTKQPQIT